MSVLKLKSNACHKLNALHINVTHHSIAHIQSKSQMISDHYTCSTIMSQIITSFRLFNYYRDAMVLIKPLALASGFWSNPLNIHYYYFHILKIAILAIGNVKSNRIVPRLGVIGRPGKGSRSPIKSSSTRKILR
jgi:hypothetical protein